MLLPSQSLTVCLKDTCIPQGFAEEISKDGNKRNGALRNENLPPYIKPLLISAYHGTTRSRMTIKILIVHQVFLLNHKVKQNFC